MTARGLVLTACVAGQLGAATVGVLAPSLLPLTLLCLAGAYLFHTWPPLRLITAGIATVVVLATLPHLVTAGLAQSKASLGLLLVVAQIAQVAGWRVERDERVGLLSAFGLLVLAASYAPDVLVGGPILIGWVAILLALAHHSGLRGRQLIAPTAVAVVAGLVVFLIVPIPDKAGLRSRLGAQSNAGDQSQQRGQAGADGYTGSQLSLNLRGGLSDRPILVVPNPSPSLWRASVFNTYTGQAWQQPPPTFHDQRDTEVVLTQATGPTHTYAATPAVLGIAENVYAPGTLISYHRSGPGQLLTWPTGGLAASPSEAYTVTSQDPVPLGAQAAAGKDLTDPQWLQVPASLPPRVRHLAYEITNGFTSRSEAAAQITAYLHHNEKYTLNSPVPGPDEDAVDRFLFTDHVGFCEQFASAEVVLLRSVGIPARLVTGLSGGDDQGATRVLRDKDLHAWVELWQPGLGWVTSDPTAGATIVPDAAPGFRAALSKAIAAFLHWLTTIPGGRVMLAVLLVIAALAVVLLVRALGRRKPRAAVLTAPTALAAFLRFDGRLGEDRRKASESLRELGSRLDAPVANALVVVEQEVYGPVPPDPAQAIEVLDQA